MDLKKWNENDFANNHPILTVVATVGIAKWLCRAGVGLLQAVTGKYPDPSPIYTKTTTIPDDDKKTESETVDGDVINLE